MSREFYLITVEDMTHASDAMGYAHSTTIDARVATTMKRAEDWCRKDYRKRGGLDTLNFDGRGRRKYVDALFVAYSIEPTKVV
jgi:hypothetical protein